MVIPKTTDQTSNSTVPRIFLHKHWITSFQFFPLQYNYLEKRKIKRKKPSKMVFKTNAKYH